MHADTNAPVILVVDDNRDIRDALGSLLILAGFSVRAAADGAAALGDIRASGPPNLVLLDLNMPGMDGLEFLHWRSLDAVLRKIPVMVVTANAVTRSIPYPVAGVFCKPVDLDLMIAAVQRETANRPAIPDQ